MRWAGLYRFLMGERGPDSSEGGRVAAPWREQSERWPLYRTPGPTQDPLPGAYPGEFKVDRQTLEPPATTERIVPTPSPAIGSSLAGTVPPVIRPVAAEPSTRASAVQLGPGFERIDLTPSILPPGSGSRSMSVPASESSAPPLGFAGAANRPVSRPNHAGPSNGSPPLDDLTPWRLPQGSRPRSISVSAPEGSVPLGAAPMPTSHSNPVGEPRFPAPESLASPFGPVGAVLVTSQTTSALAPDRQAPPTGLAGVAISPRLREAAVEPSRPQRAVGPPTAETTLLSSRQDRASLEPRPSLRQPALGWRNALPPALSGLVQVAARRIQRGELLLTLAAAQLPPPGSATARATSAGVTPQLNSTGPDHGASPSIRPNPAPIHGWSPLSLPSAETEPTSTGEPLSEEESLFEERVRGTLDRILRLDGLRHGLQLGER